MNDQRACFHAGRPASSAHGSRHEEESEADLRRQDAIASVKSIETARKQLEDLLKKTEELAQAIDAAHKLEELAKLQEQIAQAMADAKKAGRKAVLMQVMREDANRFVAVPVARG